MPPSSERSASSTDHARPRSYRAALWRRGQRGWPASFVLVQFPNAALLGYVAATAVTHVVAGRAHDWASALARVALTIWAYEEAVRGVNWFRRGLGMAVLVGITVSLARDFG